MYSVGSLLFEVPALFLELSTVADSICFFNFFEATIGTEAMGSPLYLFSAVIT